MIFSLLFTDLLHLEYIHSHVPTINGMIDNSPWCTCRHPLIYFPLEELSCTCRCQRWTPLNKQSTDETLQYGLRRATIALCISNGFALCVTLKACSGFNSVQRCTETTSGWARTGFAIKKNHTHMRFFRLLGVTNGLLATKGVTNRRPLILPARQGTQNRRPISATSAPPTDPLAQAPPVCFDAGVGDSVSRESH